MSSATPESSRRSCAPTRPRRRTRPRERRPRRALRPTDPVGSDAGAAPARSRGSHRGMVSGGARRSPATERGYHAGREPGNKGRTYPVEVLTADEVRALLRACSRRAPTGVRHAALIVVLYRGGLRVAEALALHVRDVNAGAGTITVRHGKGDKRRT